MPVIGGAWSNKHVGRVLSLITELDARVWTQVPASSASTSTASVAAGTLSRYGGHGLIVARPDQAGPGLNAQAAGDEPPDDSLGRGSLALGPPARGAT
jgi:hypothetical protein